MLRENRKVCQWQPVDPRPVTVELIPDDRRHRVDHRLGGEALLSYSVGSSQEKDCPPPLPPPDGCLPDQERSTSIESHIEGEAQRTGEDPEDRG